MSDVEIINDNELYGPNIVVGNILRLIKLDLNKYTNRHLLNYSSYTMLFLKDNINIFFNTKNYGKLLSDKDTKYLLFLEIMRWIKAVCKKLYESIYFENKIKINKDIKIKSKEVSRSSYKFCKYGKKCNNFYGTLSITKACTKHHFVPDLVYNDVDSIIEYCETYKDNIDCIELQKSIKTISYVLKHMFNELN